MKFIKEEIYQALQYQRNNNTSLTKAAHEGSNIHLDRKYNLVKQYINLL